MNPMPAAQFYVIREFLGRTEIHGPYSTAEEAWRHAGDGGLVVQGWRAPLQWAGPL